MHKLCLKQDFETKKTFHVGLLLWLALYSQLCRPVICSRQFLKYLNILKTYTLLFTSATTQCTHPKLDNNFYKHFYI